MVTITKQITTEELKGRINLLGAKTVGLTDKDNIYVVLDNDYYLVLHKGKPIHKTATQSKISTFVEKAISDDDVHDRLIRIATGSEVN